MLLTEWSRQTGVAVNVAAGGLNVDCNERTVGFRGLWALEDYAVSSRSGPLVWLVPKGTPHREITLRTEADMRALSFYTLCRLQDTTRFANPIYAIPAEIAAGRLHGRLTVDGEGNFLHIA